MDNFGYYKYIVTYDYKSKAREKEEYTTTLETTLV
jgi:hypothetical protein